MAYILDLAVILLFILAIFLGYRRGFIKTAIRLVGCVLAIVLAGVLSPLVAGGIFDTFVSPPMEKMFASQIKSTDLDAVMNELEAGIDQIPSSITNALEAYGAGTPQQILDSAKAEVNGNIASLPGMVVKLMRPVAVSLLSALCFFVLFIVLMIVVAILASLINKAFRLPVIKQVNGVLGAVLGAVQGVVLVLVAVTVLQLVANSSSQEALISRQDVEGSILVSRIADINPITNALDKVKAAKAA